MLHYVHFVFGIGKQCYCMTACFHLTQKLHLYSVWVGRMWKKIPHWLLIEARLWCYTKFCDPPDSVNRLRNFGHITTRPQYLNTPNICCCFFLSYFINMLIKNFISLIFRLSWITNYVHTTKNKVDGNICNGNILIMIIFLGRPQHTWHAF